MTVTWRLLGCLALASVGLHAHACRQVGDEHFIQISPSALFDLASLQLDRRRIFDVARTVSLPETQGCWGGSTGSFDGELISAGFVQWNLGQGSLQSLLKAYRGKMSHSASLRSELDRAMPFHGAFLLSEGCTRTPVTAQCAERVRSLQSAAGVLHPEFKREVDALFETDAMVQIQVDHFVSLLGKVKSSLKRVFPASAPSPLQVKWALDTKVQQGSFPGDADLARVRRRMVSLTHRDARKDAVLAILQWYEGHARTIDQDGIRHDWRWNLDRWRAATQKGLSDEQLELLHLSYLRSRTAGGESGLWQALTFQRRATIIFGTGSVHGRRHEGPSI